jgi:hypothetical protein
VDQGIAGKLSDQTLCEFAKDTSFALHNGYNLSDANLIQKQARALLDLRSDARRLHALDGFGPASENIDERQYAAMAVKGGAENLARLNIAAQKINGPEKSKLAPEFVTKYGSLDLAEAASSGVALWDAAHDSSRSAHEQNIALIAFFSGIGYVEPADADIHCEKLLISSSNSSQ